ncbi:sulfate transporter [Rubinisphaera sp. ICM_H10]|nr:SulP family inorganic anion transporter [Rubinisphaera margarita]MCG6158487.1 sulfate transporter [Rubinisphaera margarita]
MSQPSLAGYQPSYFLRDFTSGLVVFLVALPLCLGIALASGAPLFSGLLAGCVGGLVVGALSGSHTSVSGPAAGLTAIVSAQIATLGSFDAFLLAVVFAGVIQVVLGILRAGALSAFFPSSVIKGLLAAIGVILILKQIPHVLGHDTDPEGEMSFKQPDNHNTFSELLTLFEGEIHFGAAMIGILSVILLLFWENFKVLKKSKIPAALVVVILGVIAQMFLPRLGEQFAVRGNHLVQIPVADSVSQVVTFLTMPDFSQWLNPAIYLAAVTIAIVASLETLLNLEAVDKLDKEKRDSPASRELVAQGVGNMVAGMIGGLPMTSVIVRSSVNVDAGGKTKLAAIIHGIFLTTSIVLFPVYLNMIPLASLAAILLVTGFKLASPKLFREMWNEGRYQFAPFIITLLAIVFTDLLIGIIIGLCVALLFILNSNLRRPIRRTLETHLDGQVMHIELANQVSFLNRASLDKLFNEAQPGSHILVDARSTDYIDPDILSLIRDFKNDVGPSRGVTVSTRGFRRKYQLRDEIRFADYSSRELQDRVTPEQVLDILKDGNRRFRTGTQLTRDFSRQVDATAGGQSPLAAVLSCIDSRVPVELVFDLGIGDVFSTRVAGNIIGTKSLASLEYAVCVANVKLVVVLGHTRCGAVTSSVQMIGENKDICEVTGCAHLNSIVEEVEHAVDRGECARAVTKTGEEFEEFVDTVAADNARRTVDEIINRSEAIRKRLDAGQVIVVPAMYDVRSGEIRFLSDEADSQ